MRFLIIGAGALGGYYGGALVRQIGSAGAPSMLFDIESGRPTEAEHIFGDLVRRADRLGIDAPILRAALCNLQIYEARRQTQARG